LLPSIFSKKKSKELVRKFKVYKMFRATIHLTGSKTNCRLVELKDRDYVSCNLKTLKKLRKKLPKIVDRMTALDVPTISQESSLELSKYLYSFCLNIIAYNILAIM
jgi:hypothetical protein